MKPEQKAKIDKVLEAARGVDPQKRAARIRFILWAIAADLWVPKKTTAPIAKLWKLSRFTVDRDVSDAAMAHAVTSDRHELGKFATQTTHAMVEDRVTLASGLAKRLEDELEAKAKPSHLRDVASALGSVEASLSRSLEWLGKVGGLTNDTPMVQVVIEGQPTKVRPEELATMPTQLLDALRRVVKQHPELAPVVPLLRAEIERSLGSSEPEIVEVKKLPR